MVTVTFTGVTPNNGSGYTGAQNQADFTGSEIIVDVLLTLSANYGTGASHGDPLSFAGNPQFSFGSLAPSHWQIEELLVAGAAPLGFKYNYNPGPTLAAPTQNGGNLQIIGTGAASGQGGTEITQGSAYANTTPSLNGAVLKARFWFVRGL